jgi:pimeloyl-ACP methyl ester carboxylesterase
VIRWPLCDRRLQAGASGRCEGDDRAVDDDAAGGERGPLRGPVEPDDDPLIGEVLDGAEVWVGGVRAGYDRYRRDFARLIWRTASPEWNFGDATFDRTAASFDNPDHVAIVIHNYRWRLGLAEGEAEYSDLEERLAEGPVITVPAITLEGDANGAPHPDPGSYAGKFSGRYSHRTIEGGIGHNLPQEAPEAFANAVIDAGTH